MKSTCAARDRSSLYFTTGRFWYGSYQAWHGKLLEKSYKKVQNLIAGMGFMLLYASDRSFGRLKCALLAARSSPILSTVYSHSLFAFSSPKILDIGTKSSISSLTSRVSSSSLIYIFNHPFESVLGFSTKFFFPPLTTFNLT